MVLDPDPHPDKLYGMKRKPMRKPDRSGKIKMQTLQHMELNPWCSALEMSRDPIFSVPSYSPVEKLLSIRLMRYYREGLLQRRRRKRGFEYHLTGKGEDRLIFLWHKHNYGISSDTQIARELLVGLKGMEKGILERQITRAESVARKQLDSLISTG